MYRVVISKICSILILSVSLTSCSTLKGRTLSYMGSAFIAGAITGAAQTKERENRDLHGLLWGSVAAAVVGATMVSMYDENSDLQQRDYKIRELEAKLSDQKVINSKEKNDGVTDFMESKLPKSYRHLISPGKWRVYQIDEWKKNNEGEFVHQDQILEIIPAQIKIE